MSRKGKDFKKKIPIASDPVTVVASVVSEEGEEDGEEVTGLEVKEKEKKT